MSIFSINSKNAASQMFKLSSEVFANNAAEALRIVSNALASKANEQLSKKAVDFTDPRIARKQEEIDKYQAQKEAFIDQATLLSKVKQSLSKIDIRLNEIKNALLTLNSASTAQERADAAALLDEKLLEINGLARDAGGYGKNPIGKPSTGEFKTADVIATYIPFGEPLVVKGQFAGSDFKITDGEGQTWRYDRSTGTLAEFDSWPDTPTGVSYSASQVSVDSFDDTTGAVTLNTPGGPVSGTVTRYGQGVLDSFLYNDLATDADVARALDDVNEALATFGAKKAVISGAAVTLEGRLGQLNLRINGLDAKIQGVMDEMVDEKAAADKALRTRVELQQQALSLSLGSAGAMVDMFFRDAIETGSILDRF